MIDNAVFTEDWDCSRRYLSTHVYGLWAIGSSRAPHSLYMNSIPKIKESEVLSEKLLRYLIRYHLCAIKI